MHQRTSFVCRLLALSLSLTLAGFAAACSNVNVDEHGQIPGDATSDDACPAPLPGSTFLAISGHDLCGETLGPGALLLTMGESDLLACNDQGSYDSDYSWLVSILVPLELQHLGSFIISQDTTGKSSSVKECVWTHGGDRDGCDSEFIEATLTILKIDAKHVTFTVTGIDALGWGFNADGTYDAIRCRK